MDPDIIVEVNARLLQDVMIKVKQDHPTATATEQAYRMQEKAFEWLKKELPARRKPMTPMFTKFGAFCQLVRRDGRDVCYLWWHCNQLSSPIPVSI